MRYLLHKLSKIYYFETRKKACMEVINLGKDEYEIGF